MKPKAWPPWDELVPYHSTHAHYPEQRQALYERMVREIATKLLPPRRARSNARVVKRKMSNFKLKREEHYQPPIPEHPFRKAVQIQTPLVLDLVPPKIVPQQTTRADLRRREPVLI